MKDCPERNRLISKMFEAVLEAKFYRMALKYDPDRVQAAWMRLAADEGVKDYFGKWRWTGNMTLDQALDEVEHYVGFIESSIGQPAAKA